MAWFAVLAALTVAAFCIAIAGRSQRKKQVFMSRQSKTDVEAMSLEEARSMVLDLIAKGEKLIATPAGETGPLTVHLGPITRELFSRYGTLKTPRGGFELSVVGIRASEYIQGFMSIGHSEDWDVVQRQGTDEVLVVEGAETSESEVETRFASVYHLLVDEALQA